MSVPKVAICIPTYNQGAFLPKSVESVVAQTWSNLEIWISDDASTDDTPAIATALQNSHTVVHYHRHPHNLGISANNNWLFGHPDAEFIVRLDSDDLLLPQYIEKTVGLLSKYPTAGYAHVTVQEIDENGQNTRVRRLAGRGSYQDPVDALRRCISGYRVAANIITFRSKVLREAGYYRKGMNFAEDWDLAARIAELGWGNVYSDEMLACYRVWSRPKQQTLQRKIQEIDGCISLYEETIEPAFAKRAWSTKAIAKQRKKLALSYSLFLDSEWLSSEERNVLIQKFRQLGESAMLQLLIIMLRFGFGGFFRWRTNAITTLKDFIKAVLRRLSHLFSDNTLKGAS